MLLESDREYYLSRRTFISLTKDIYFSHEGHFFLSLRTLLSLTKDISFSHRTHRSNRTFLRTGSSPKDSGPSPNPSPAGRGVVCEVTPTGLLTRGVSKHFSHAGEFFLSQSAQSSRSFLAHCFEPTEGLRHTENTERYC